MNNEETWYELYCKSCKNLNFINKENNMECSVLRTNNLLFEALVKDCESFYNGKKRVCNFYIPKKY